MRQTPPSRSTVTLHELPAPALAQAARPLLERDRIVFVTNALHRRSTLRTRGEQRRPVVAAVVR